MPEQSTVSGRLLAVNVGRVRTVRHQGRSVRTGIYKEPVAHPVEIRGVNLDGDDQADRTVHGGVDKAVYAYAREDYQWWEVELGRPLAPGTFGENLTTQGIDVSAARVGEHWHVGGALLEVSEPRVPCYKLAMRMEDPEFVRRFATARRPGAYLRIVREGAVRAGDAIELVSRPDSLVTVGDVAEIFLFDRSRASELLQVSALGDDWRQWAAEVVARS